MKIGIMYSGMEFPNGADYVASFMANALRVMGIDFVELGGFGCAQCQEIPNGLDCIIHSSGSKLTSELVEKFKKKTKVFLWSHNDDLELWWPEIINPITNLVDKHFSYTKEHNYGSHVVYLPLAADHTIYKKTGHTKKYNAGMVGCLHDWRKLFYVEIINRIDFGRFNFNLSMPNNLVNQLYNETKIMLAPMQDCDQVKILDGKTVFGCPCRTFDVPASGAFQLQVFREGLADVYENVPIVMPISDPVLAAQEWEKEINYWLEHEKEREEIALDLYNQTMEKNLYIHRMKTMLEYI